jgi:DNA-binding NtrC family response regulator
LAERTEDIPLIVHGFIEQNALRTGKKIGGLTPDAMEALLSHEWPGNVRELRNAIEYAFVLCPGGWIEKQHLPPKIGAPDRRPRSRTQRRAAWNAERARLVQALRKAAGNRSEAGRLLGVSRVTIWKRIKKYAIDLETDL